MVIIGKIINNQYKIMEKIKDGGMSEVWYAWDIINNKQLALKILKKEITSNKIENIIRFRKEATTISTLNHINIVKTKEIGEYEGLNYIVMELVKGKSLYDFIEEGITFNQNQVLEIITGICNALKYMHNLGIIHRDLKPGNIMIVTEKGYKEGCHLLPKLLDFGLAELKEYTAINEHEIAGTFSYMSPEQSGIIKKPVDARSDLYSLGVIFYQLLTEELPFEGKDISTILHQQIAKVPDPPTKLKKDIPRLLERIILKLLRKEQEERYQSAQGLIHDLKKFQQGEVDFILGKKDTLIKLPFKTHLIERDKEISHLKEIYNSASKGKGEKYLLSGEEKTFYRYPGVPPFTDNEIDRLLFFGREEETRSFFHLVLNERLSILFAKSGLGKTSLLNARIVHLLKEQEYIPFKIRFNDPSISPVQAVYNCIEEALVKSKIEYNKKETETFWEYFKIAEFWSHDNTLLTPVLLFDQFEEFFILHKADVRKEFITQLSNLIRGRVPKNLIRLFREKKDIPYTSSLPNVKVVISIREDFLGYLQEFSDEIPSIMDNRFRLLPLNRENAQKAIEEPAKVENEKIRTKSFSYSPETIKAMLDFLCKTRIGNDIKMTDEVEPFQLQLLCQYIERKMQYKKKEGSGPGITVQETDLGGEAGMQRVMQDFYDNQVNQAGSVITRWRVRKLVEKGLISSTDRRISLEEEQIELKYKVSKEQLSRLVNNRLLRAEPRVGSVYYELSHDTLIKPVRKSQFRKRRRNRIVLSSIVFLLGLCAALFIFYLFIKNYYDDYIKKGDHYYSINQYSNAMEYYNKAIQTDNTKALAYKKRGDVYFEQNQIERAQSDYLKAIDLDPDFADAYNGLRTVLNTKTENRLNFYKSAFKYTRESLIAQYKMGNALYYEGEYVAAKEYYEYAKNLFDDVVDKRIKIDIYIRTGRGCHYQENYEEAIENLRKVIELDPYNVKAYNSLGRVYYDQGQNEKAIENYIKAIEIDPECADAYIYLGIVYDEQGEYEKAIKNYRKTIEIDPGYAFAYNNLGCVYSDQGEYEKAIENYRKTIEIDPGFASAYFNLGIVYDEQGEYEKAIKNYRKTIEIDPGYAFAYNNLGKVYYDQGQYEKAIESYRKAIELDPECADAYIYLGIVYYDQGQYEKVIESYMKAIEINPEYTDAYYNLGYVYYDQEQYEKAIESYRKAIELDPECVGAYFNLGIAYKVQGQYEQAIESYRKAIEINPKHTSAYYSLGIIYYDQGQYEKAIENYRKAINLDPDHTNAKEWLKKAEEKLNSGL